MAKTDISINFYVLMYSFILIGGDDIYILLDSRSLLLHCNENACKDCFIYIYFWCFELILF